MNSVRIGEQRDGQVWPNQETSKEVPKNAWLPEETKHEPRQSCDSEHDR